MQPRYRHTPPGFNSGSMSVTVMPRSAARNAAAYPPGPPPTTAMCRFVVSDMRLSTTKGTKVHEGTHFNQQTLVSSWTFVSFVVHAFDFHPCTDSRNGCSNACRSEGT